MATGIIVIHCWTEMQHPFELQAMDNIKQVLEQKDLPTLGTRITRADIRPLLKEHTDHDLMLEKNKIQLQHWLEDNDIDHVALVGLHYNLCVRQVESRLFEICEAMGRHWNNDFKVSVIEECTAASVGDKVLQIQEYKQDNETHNLVSIEQWQKNL